MSYELYTSCRDDMRNTGDKENEKWISTVIALRCQLLREAKSIDNILTLLAQLYNTKKDSKSDEEIYEALLSQAKKTYKLASRPITDPQGES